MRIRLGIPLSDIIEGVTVNYLTTDSREAEAGDLFFPLRGKNGDGALYVNDALARGAIIAPMTLSELAAEYKKRLTKLIQTFTVVVRNQY